MIYRAFERQIGIVNTAYSGSGQNLSEVLVDFQAVKVCGKKTESFQESSFVVLKLNDSVGAREYLNPCVALNRIQICRNAVHVPPPFGSGIGVAVSYCILNELDYFLLGDFDVDSGPPRV